MLNIFTNQLELFDVDLSQLMDLPLTEQSEDNSQWQSVNDIIGQLPVDQTGLSFSDALKVFCLINSGDSIWISSTCMSDSSDQVLLSTNTESDESIVPGPTIILA
jgi:hypothetical protein